MNAVIGLSSTLGSRRARGFLAVNSAATASQALTTFDFIRQPLDFNYLLSPEPPVVPTWQKTGVGTQAPVQYIADLIFITKKLYDTLTPLREIEPLRAPSATNIALNARDKMLEIKRLVESGRIREARRYLLGLRTSMEQDPEIDLWSRVLSEPKVTVEPRATGGALGENSAWLKQHAREYQGLWVALKQGVFLGSHENRAELHRALEKVGKISGAMFVRLG